MAMFEGSDRRARQAWPGLTDREITDRLEGASALQQPVNQATRALAARPAEQPMKTAQPVKTGVAIAHERASAGS